MPVKLHINPILMPHAGDKAVVDVKGSTVGECLQDLVRQFPDIRAEIFDSGGQILSYIEVFINRESTYPELLARKVQAGDELELFFLIDGG